jgi:N-acetylglucosaminyldiphosphoundecaprenol N-acetyl-beta-D-mannosaminyltransferase
MRQHINRFAPDVLFVGMTAPKQEKWGYQNKQYLNTHVIVTIGNVFDWYAGNSKRPGPIWQKMGLEWLVRIFYRPEILKRNLSNQMLFFWHLILFVLKLKKHD